MRLIRYRPTAPLDAYVECFWWSYRDQPQLFCERMLPSGHTHLIIALHDTSIVSAPGSPGHAVSWSGGVVHGPQGKYFISGPKPCGAVVGASFRAGAAAAVLGIPITEVTDRHITLDALWGHRGRALQERLLTAQNPSAIFRILERDLTSRLVRPLLIHPAVAHSLAAGSRSGSPTRIAEVQRETGYSPKHFIALFRSAVGLTPKHYDRVQRFSRVVRGLADLNKTSLADLAISAGYSDQSHLTREFRAFAGITPTQYQPRGPDSAFHTNAGPASAFGIPR
jgi:AraC-like DNA-binding protein